MTPDPITSIDALQGMMAEPRLTRHEITFQLRIVAFNGKAITDDIGYARALFQTDDKALKALENGITHFRFRDHDGIEGSRLTFCQPEYGYDDALPEDTPLYDVTMYTGYEIALSRADATDELPLSIQQLIDEVPAILIREYGTAGVTLERHRVTFYQQFETSRTGYYEFS